MGISSLTHRGRACVYGMVPDFNTDVHWVQFSSRGAQQVLWLASSSICGLNDENIPLQMYRRMKLSCRGSCVCGLSILLSLVWLSFLIYPIGNKNRCTQEIKRGGALLTHFA